MIIFNLIAIVEGILALIPAALVFGVLYLIGFNPNIMTLAVLLGSAAFVDILWRLAGMAGSDGSDGEEPTQGAGVMNLLWPNGGGHLFFLPVWLIGGFGALAFTGLGVFSIFL